MMKAHAPHPSPRLPHNSISQGSTHPERMQVSRSAVRQPNARAKTTERVTTRAKVQGAKKEATAVVENTQQRRLEWYPRRCVAMQRPAAVYTLPRASEASAQRDAATSIASAAAGGSVDVPTRYGAVAYAHGSANAASSSTSSSCYDSAASAVAAGNHPEVDPEAPVAPITGRCLVEARREAPHIASGYPSPPLIASSSSISSTSDLDHQRILPSRMRDIFAFALSNKSHNSGAGVKGVALRASRNRARPPPVMAKGVSSHVASSHPLAQKPSRTIRSPFVWQQPVKGALASSSSFSCPSECVVAADPFAAAVQEAGDPLVLRHAIGYLLSKARRLERENQCLWWQAHSWDPHRALESRDCDPVASPPAYRRVRSAPSLAATATCTPTVVSSKILASKQARHLRGPPQRVFVKRQPSLSQENGRSASWTSTSSLSERSVHRGSIGEGGNAAAERNNASPDPRLRRVPVVSPSAAADTPSAQSTELTRTTATSAVPRAEVGVQCRQGPRNSAVDAIQHPSPVCDKLTSALEAAGAVAEALQPVFSSPHANASAQTEIVTPLAPALLRTPDRRRDALQHRSRGTESGNGRDVSAATPTVSTVRSRRSIDSDCSLGAVAAHATPLQWYSLLEKQQRRRLGSCSSHVCTTGTSNEGTSLAPRGQFSTYSKQVQTARICSPSVDEVGGLGEGSGGDNALRGSFKDGISSVTSTERTAVIELHTSASYTRSTVRRLRKYCQSLEVMRQQLRRRLSRSITSSSIPSALEPPYVHMPSSRSCSHSQLPLALPVTAASNLSRPFFTSEYADPEVDATLHDVDETAAVETMIVLHEDGAGTITKRVLDGSHLCISSSAARSSSSQSQNLAAAAASSATSKYKAVVTDGAASRVHRNSPLRLHRPKPQQVLPHSPRDTQVPEDIGEDPRARWHSSSFRSSSCCCSVPVVHLGKRMRSASGSFWGASNPQITPTSTVPLAPSLSNPLRGESPLVARFVVPHTTPFEEGDVKQLPPPQSHGRQTEVTKSASPYHEGQDAPEQVSGLQTGVASRTRSSGRVISQRFAVREASQSTSSKELAITRGSRNSCSSATSEDLVPVKQTSSSTTAAATAAPPRDPTRHLSRTPNPVAFSIAVGVSAAAAPPVSGHFVTPVATSIGEADLRGAQSDTVRRPRPITTSPRTTAGNTTLSPLSVPEPSSEEALPPVASQGQQAIQSPVRHPHVATHAARHRHGGSDGRSNLSEDSLHLSEAGSLGLSPPQNLETNSGGRCKRSNTASFFEEERREASAVMSAGKDFVEGPPPVMENNMVSPDGADSFHSREAAVSSLSSAEKASGFLSPAQLEESSPLQLQRSSTQRLISPSPPRWAAASNTAQNRRYGSADVMVIPQESASQDAVIDLLSPRRPLALPRHRPPFSPPRGIVPPKGDDSSSSANSSLHSLCSTLSDSADGDDDDREVGRGEPCSEGLSGEGEVRGASGCSLLPPSSLKQKTGRRQ
ncbi:hypothetical protein LSCM1_02113 [Leishmania martiniquensis]|uniref:Uncharacterized protein n=1 Tax=Leishmania martiniquensis TaxID=1580590 RepID=A0A836KES3_9TRYP|nr:hypothetical protein LSCM1_02113 [Leishmania martiniquensis]